MGAEYDKGYEAGIKSFPLAKRDSIERHRQQLEQNRDGYRQDMAILTEENLNSAWNLGVLEGFDAARRQASPKKKASPKKRKTETKTETEKKASPKTRKTETKTETEKKASPKKRKTETKTETEKKASPKTRKTETKKKASPVRPTARESKTRSGKTRQAFTPRRKKG